MLLSSTNFWGLLLARRSLHEHRHRVTPQELPEWNRRVVLIALSFPRRRSPPCWPRLHAPPPDFLAQICGCNHHIPQKALGSIEPFKTIAVIHPHMLPPTRLSPVPHLAPLNSLAGHRAAKPAINLGLRANSMRSTGTLYNCRQILLVRLEGPGPAPITIQRRSPPMRLSLNTLPLILCTNFLWPHIECTPLQWIQHAVFPEYLKV